ncbi:integration host factor [Candidatus Uhrbacteria bacterium CG22_combo_CG10-13_8_21_14_all_47_17]|uniref:Integration host factor n=1 Tax=Candidatus Uhrbacteria bacterium CG22_combo_CG10-13_8_21_14_all_47_17 TaxID=1975041 RepID=A0A2H0BTG8_9BACT|nr:MAG: integration host factor [Candidatus Uhrbacteria bacterium CG22_combo_CG10-13_8_21_14_all_47_17]
MNKAELINTLSERVGITKKQAEDLVEGFVDTVTETLQKGGEVNIAGFGAFTAKTRAARMGVNPQKPTEKIHIPAVTVPKFKAGKGLKDALKRTGAAAAEAPSASPEMTSPSEPSL